MSDAMWRASSAIWLKLGPHLQGEGEPEGQGARHRACRGPHLDLILHPNRKPVNPIDVLLGNKPKQPELPAEEKQRIAQKADELRGQLMRGELEDFEVEVEVEDAPKDVEINGASVNSAR